MHLVSYLSFLFHGYFWLLFGFAWIVNAVIKGWMIRKRLPHGPTPIPLVGNYFGGEKLLTHDLTMKLRAKFGDTFTIFFLNTPNIILFKYEDAKNVFGQTTFSSRLDSGFVHMVLSGVPDIGFAKFGPLWQFHRKTVVKCLREIIDFESLELKVVAAVDLTIGDMLANTEKVNADFAPVMALDALPYAKYLIPYLRYWPFRCLPMIKRVMQTAAELENIRSDMIEEHKRTFVQGQTRDFCDALIREQEALKREGPEQAAQLSDGHISSILFDFFSAGTDTTANTLTWFCLFMIMNPEVQEECYQAVKETIGDRLPTLKDKSSLPIIEAAISETLRLRPAAPMGMPHSNDTDADIGPYTIPQGSSVMANIYAMHIDPACWESPHQFDPKLHFIDDEGRLKKTTSFAPFGFGRRACPGEQLARNNTFIIATRLLQKVRLEPLEGVEYNLNYDLNQDLTFAALPYFARVVSRE